MKNGIHKKERRKFLKILSMLATFFGTISIPLLYGRKKDIEEKGEKEIGNTDKKKRKWGMVIDLDLCTGCGACVAACKIENNIPYVDFNDERSWGTQIEWMTLLRNKGVIMPLPCFHCDDPPCAKVCPVGATYINEEGIVAQIWDRCIGCRYCQVACPYQRKYFNWKSPQWPETYVQAMNPDVAPRPAGIIEKCTFCYHRLRRVREKAKDEGREIRDDEVMFLPACAETCPTRAIVFGDINDPESIVYQLSKSPRAFRIAEFLGTEPKVFYLAEEKRKYLNFGDLGNKEVV